MAEDVRNEYVSSAEAERTYGAILTPDLAPDLSATAAKRERLRAERLALAQAPAASSPGKPIGASRTLVEWGGALRVVQGNGDSTYWQCGKCNHVLGSTEQDWKRYAARHLAPQSRGQSLEIANSGDRFQLREYYCPACAFQFEVLTQERGDPEIVTVKLAPAGESDAVEAVSR